MYRGLQDVRNFAAIQQTLARSSPQKGNLARFFLSFPFFFFESTNGILYNIFLPYIVALPSNIPAENLLGLRGLYTAQCFSISLIGLD